MKRAVAVLAVASSLVGTSIAAEASTNFHATMTFDQEVPTVPAFDGPVSTIATSAAWTFVKELSEAFTCDSHELQGLILCH